MSVKFAAAALNQHEHKIAIAIADYLTQHTDAGARIGEVLIGIGEPSGNSRIATLGAAVLLTIVRNEARGQ
jgi:hypothetical protein